MNNILRPDNKKKKNITNYTFIPFVRLISQARTKIFVISDVHVLHKGTKKIWALNEYSAFAKKKELIY